MTADISSIEVEKRQRFPFMVAVTQTHCGEVNRYGLEITTPSTCLSDSHVRTILVPSLLVRLCLVYQTIGIPVFAFHLYDANVEFVCLIVSVFPPTNSSLTTLGGWGEGAATQS